MASRLGGIDEVVNAITSGGVAVIPTDTVYGLVCDPANAGAVERIYAIKQRPPGLELTLLAAAVADVEAAVELSEPARRLAGRYWPGPLSIVASLGRRRLAIPRAGATLSCRVPAHEIALEVLRRTGPLASTSANLHGTPPAITAEEAAAQLGSDVDAILGGGASIGLASTIIDCTTTPPRVLREGPIAGATLLSYLSGPQSTPLGSTLPEHESSEG
jgi:tRNA threonylcarbamoyl adenosine modification protein (Sua5/YciO/YrdC/YwlC family)